MTCSKTVEVPHGVAPQSRGEGGVPRAGDSRGARKITTWKVGSQQMQRISPCGDLVGWRSLGHDGFQLGVQAVDGQGDGEEPFGTGRLAKLQVVANRGSVVRVQQCKTYSTGV